MKKQIAEDKKNNQINLVTVKELSKFIGIKGSTLYAWAEKRMIPFIKLNGLLRFDTDEVMEWVKSSKVLPGKVYPLNLKPKIITKKKIDQAIEREVALSKRQRYDSPQRGNQTSQAQKGGNHGNL